MINCEKEWDWMILVQRDYKFRIRQYIDSIQTIDECYAASTMIDNLKGNHLDLRNILCDKTFEIYIKKYKNGSNS